MTLRRTLEVVYRQPGALLIADRAGQPAGCAGLAPCSAARCGQAGSSAMHRPEPDNQLFGHQSRPTLVPQIHHMTLTPAPEGEMPAAQ
jgi:N-acetylglutamate synthase-like GNAT family acetyltransferase